MTVKMCEHGPTGFNRLIAGSRQGKQLSPVASVVARQTLPRPAVAANCSLTRSGAA